MWDWLDEGVYSSGAAYPIVGIMVFLFAVSMTFWGISVLKTRQAKVHVGTGEIAVDGKSAVVLGVGLCVAGLIGFVGLATLLF